MTVHPLSSGVEHSAAPPTSPRARAAMHTAAAESLAGEGAWEQAYSHLQEAVTLLGCCAHDDELARLRREHAEAREQSRRDSLTASYNRRYLDERLAALVAGRDPALRTAGLCLALVDVDHFKVVNDTFGHLLGDRVLQRLAAELGAALPEPGFCARYGGEEFALVLPGREPAEAVEIGEMARERIARHPWSVLHPDLQVTVSIGVAYAPSHPADVERLVGDADLLLYAAKQAGRNAVAYRSAIGGRIRLAGAAEARRPAAQPMRTTG